MPYLTQFLIVAGIHLLAAMSPGPDFVMITRNTLKYSKKVGVYSAIGLGVGILVHVTYSLVGLGFVIAKSILLFSILKFLGAAYLVYIGYKSLRAKARPTTDTSIESGSTENMNWFEAIKMGFLTNVLNPKVTLFFLSLFTQVIDPKTPLWIQVLYGVEMSLATFLWFAFVAHVFSSQRIKGRIGKIQHYIEKTMGAILIALGIKLAVSRSQ